MILFFYKSAEANTLAEIKETEYLKKQDEAYYSQMNLKSLKTK
jgi:hypothetical protein